MGNTGTTSKSRRTKVRTYKQGALSEQGRVPVKSPRLRERPGTGWVRGLPVAFPAGIKPSAKTSSARAVLVCEQGRWVFWGVVVGVFAGRATSGRGPLPPSLAFENTDSHNLMTAGYAASLVSMVA